MGSGKTAVGKKLSEALSFPFVDLDHYIEQAEGRSITQLFQDKGEVYFRKKEAAAVAHWLEDKEQQVIALGGGTPCYGTVMETIRKSDAVQTVYLKASIQTLTARLFPERNKRPVISHLETEELLEEFIRKHLFERGFYYNQASITVAVDDRSLRDIVEDILLRLF